MFATVSTSCIRSWRKRPRAWLKSCANAGWCSPFSFADVRSLYGRYAGSEVLENCWATHIEGEIHDRTEELVDQLLATPLVSDESIWKHVDHALLVVSGTRELGLSDVQDIVGILKDRLPKNLSLATSASLEEEGHEKVRLTVLLAMTAPVKEITSEDSPEAESAPLPRRRAKTETVALPAIHEPVSHPTAKPAPAKKSQPLAPKAIKTKPALLPKPEPVLESEVELEEELPQEMDIPLLADAPSTSRKIVAKQEEMQFEGPPRGRFEKTHETIHKGENLDQPTFRRRRLVIKL